MICKKNRLKKSSQKAYHSKFVLSHVRRHVCSCAITCTFSTFPAVAALKETYFK